MGIKREIFWRIALAYFMVLAFAGAIVFRIFQIQHIEGSYWRSMSDSLSLQLRTVDAERGNIYSADGKLLATSLPVFEIRLDLKADGLTDELWHKNIDSLCLALSNLFKSPDPADQRSARDYKNLLEKERHKGSRYFLLRSEVSYDEYLLLRRFPLFRNGSNGGGLIAIEKNKREYPYQDLALRTIGYARNNAPSIGLEAHFNEALAGIQGSAWMQKITGGVWVPIDKTRVMDPQNGQDVITTIDCNIQDVAEAALQKALVKNKADHGCVIVMETATGAIKAIANQGLSKDGSYGEIFNYAIGEALQPGSTFKLASMISLFDDHLVKPDDLVDVERGVKNYFGQTMRDAETDEFSVVTVRKAFAISSNVGISKLVYENYNKNPEKYLQHLRDLLLDQPINLEIPGVARPQIKNTKDRNWSAVSLPWMGVGYELQIAPLQTLQLYNAIANQGKMMKPYLVSDIQQYGKTLQHFDPQVMIPKICSDQTLAYTKDLLEDVVNEGTASNLHTAQYRIAGKTGTAVESAPGASPKIYQPSFVGYFPADAPQYTCIVVVYNPTAGQYYGSAVAGPVFKEISDYIFSTNLNWEDKNHYYTSAASLLPQFKPGNREDVNTLLQFLHLKTPVAPNADWLSLSADIRNVSFQARAVPAQELVVPDVTGLGLKDALYLLEEAGLEVKVVGYGIVKSQSLPANQKFIKGSPITINLST